MTILAAVTPSSVQSAVGSAVLHFLWQGALIALFAWVLLGCLRQRSSAERYAVAYGAMLLCFAAFCASFATALADLSAVAGSSPTGVSMTRAEPADVLPLRPGATGVAAWCWVVGVLGMALRFALQIHGARRLKTTAVFEPDFHWVRAFDSLKEELGISRGVRLLRSGLAEVPMVVGWLRPIVLVPVAAFTGLGPDQLRSLLAHELAHVRRHDHLLNAAQAVVEIVLFFHPLVWWISKQVRIEREYCCDDSSVRLTGDPRHLAEALAAMEAIRIHEPRTHTILAANGGPLMHRISRILGARLDGRSSLAGWQLPAGLVLAGALSVAGSAYAITPVPPARGVETVAPQDDMRPEARKVWNELQAAVEKGVLTEAQAKEKFAAWRKSLADKKDPAQQTDRVDAKQAWARLEAAVKAGRITESQAKERFAAWEKKTAEEHDVRVHAEKVWAELQARVKSGEITEAQAREKFAALRKTLAQKETTRQADPEAVIKKIAAAVEAGELTPEQGKERIEAYKRHLAAKKAEREAELEAVTLRIKTAVASGRITPEQGQERLEAYKNSVEQKEAPRSDSADPKAMIERLHAAVKSGRITPEQAEERIKALKKALAERQAAQQVQELEGMMKRIQAAVDSGRITPEQAEERLEAYKKRLAEQKQKQKRAPEKESKEKERIF